MNDFDQAFYTCDNGASFMMSYDSPEAESAKMKTNDSNKLYVLKRTPAATGVELSGGNARFWTDGKKVQVEGTQSPFRNCKRRPN